MFSDPATRSMLLPWKPANDQNVLMSPSTGLVTSLKEGQNAMEREQELLVKWKYYVMFVDDFFNISNHSTWVWIQKLLLDTKAI